MAFNKSHLFDPEDQATSAMAHLLSHPARVDMLRFLVKNGSSSVARLVDRYPLAQSTVSQHLELFRKADLVQYRECYPFIFYTIDIQTLKELNNSLMEYCKSIEETISLITKSDG